LIGSPAEAAKVFIEKPFSEPTTNNALLHDPIPMEIITELGATLVADFAATLGWVGVPGLDGGAYNQDFALYIINAQQAGGGQ